MQNIKIWKNVIGCLVQLKSIDITITTRMRKLPWYHHVILKSNIDVRIDPRFCLFA